LGQSRPRTLLKIGFVVMKSTVFVRPNLRAFVLGSILLLLLHHLISNVHSQASASSRPLPVNAREITDAQLQQLIRRATESPSAETYMQISHYYEARGDYKKALLFLRRAEKVEPVSERFE